MTSTILHYHRGRVALHAILEGLRVRPGDEVVVQAYTCAAVVEPLLRLGVTPVYADIDPDSFGPDPDAIAAAVTGRTRAVIVQHTFGVPAPVEEIDVDVPVIEDCAHVTPGLIDTSRSAAAFYSFEWGKPVVAGIGGTAVVHDAELATAMRANHHRYTAPPSRRELMIGAEYAAYRASERAGIVHRLRALYRRLAGMGLVVGSYAPDPRASPEYGWRMSCGTRRRLTARITAGRAELHRRRQIADAYEIEFQRLMPGVPLRFPVLVGDKAGALRAAAEAGVELGDWFATPVHPLSGPDLAAAGYTAGSCPNAEWAAAHVVTLPVRSTTRPPDVGRAADLLNEFRAVDAHA
ncbi:DegT/DnrJ/EryC1/StrS family aminotransferase [Actinoplanes sp. G11-F43]|uniref:DegT/DnrJ/EryC1/StrS family aminotransferase n=1 Tax=Actinoplanes sp. G11-F43 TaxID=3424130 RepID=UPI003D3324F5